MICGKVLADPDEISMEIPDDTIIVPPGSGRAVNFPEDTVFQRLESSQPLFCQLAAMNKLPRLRLPDSAYSAIIPQKYNLCR